MYMEQASQITDVCEEKAAPCHVAAPRGIRVSGILSKRGSPCLFLLNSSLVGYLLGMISKTERKYTLICTTLYSYITNKYIIILYKQYKRITQKHSRIDRVQQVHRLNHQLRLSV